jgi:hypothetical protein
VGGKFRRHAGLLTEAFDRDHQTERQLKTRADVIEAIRNLRVDLNTNPDNWENPTLDRYLEAMARWLRDYGNKYNPSPSWEFIGQMLHAAKIYE